MNVELRDVRIGPFEHRWPDATERFDRGWEGTLTVDGRSRRFRHGVGRRVAYGRSRLHTVTWLDGEPRVEGVEADDHERSRALLSRIKRADGAMARSPQEIPPGYERFEIVTHRDEIHAPYGPFGLAVKVREDDLGAWARLAAIRADLRAGREAAPRAASRPAPRRAPTAGSTSELLPRERKLRVVRALVAFEGSENGPLRRGIGRLTEDPEADRLVHEDGFAFLLAVLFDQQVGYDRAWGAPLELRRRLGHLDPRRMLREPGALAEAIRRRPALHRYVNTMPRWILDACRRLLEEHGGDAEVIWSDRPTAKVLEARLDAFLGISQKKAAMTVMLLWRNRGVEIQRMDGCDVAVDIHLRRVFLRTGLVARDDALAMVEAARDLHPQLPGALDPPAWTIGRRWCHASEPKCLDCPLARACPRLTERAARVMEP